METYVLGVAIHPAAARVLDKRLEEMVFDTARAALDNAGIERGAIDHVTIAGCDELDGRSISSMLLSAPAGAYLRDETKCTDSGLIGLCLGAMRIGIGPLEVGLVVSWNQSSIAPFEDVMRMRCDPFYTRPIGLNRTLADGLFAQAVSHALGCDEEAVSRRVVEACAKAARNPRAVRRPMPVLADVSASPFVAAPLRQEHLAPLSDGAVALVLCTKSWLARHAGHRPLARLAGLSWRVDSYQLGGARLSELNAFRRTFAECLARAGLERAEQLDVIELDSQTGYHDLAYRRALGDPEEAAISPSGGPFAQNPYFCTGLVHAAEAVLQVAGQAGPVQVPGARLAAAHGSHGFAQQGHAVAVFESV